MPTSRLLKTVSAVLDGGRLVQGQGSSIAAPAQRTGTMMRLALGVVASGQRQSVRTCERRCIACAKSPAVTMHVDRIAGICERVSQVNEHVMTACTRMRCEGQKETTNGCIQQPHHFSQPSFLFVLCEYIFAQLMQVEAGTRAD